MNYIVGFYSEYGRRKGTYFLYAGTTVNFEARRSSAWKSEILGHQSEPLFCVNYSYQFGTGYSENKLINAVKLICERDNNIVFGNTRYREEKCSAKFVNSIKKDIRKAARKARCGLRIH